MIVKLKKRWTNMCVIFWPTLYKDHLSDVVIIVANVETKVEIDHYF